MSIGDNIDYTKLQLASQGFEELRFHDNENYHTEGLAISHTLGYVPICLVYFNPNVFASQAALDAFQPDISTLAFFQAPRDQWTPGTGASSQFDFQVGSSSIYFVFQSLVTNPNTYRYYGIKYYLFKQPAQA